jgi:delta 1-pyrroline-5-carboxylate dehydrogenase
MPAKAEDLAMNFVTPDPERHADIARTLPKVKLMIGGEARSYGAAGSLDQTNDLNIAQRMVRSLQAGTVFINQATPAFLAAAPFGGVGLSGFGREGGKAGLEEFIRIKGVGMSIRGTPLQAATARHQSQ